MKKQISTDLVYCIVVVLLFSTVGLADIITTNASQYLIITRNKQSGNTDLNVNNYELGSNKAPVPCTDSFLDGGSSGGPSLAGNVPSIPSNAASVFSGTGGHGNIAILDPSGLLNLQDVGVYADTSIGIRTANPTSSSSSNSSSNSFFNDPNWYPNTYDTMTQTGNTVGAGAAVQSTRIDRSGTPGDAGITWGFNFSSLETELSNAKTAIDTATATGTLNLTSSGGVIDSDTTLTYGSGLNIIDIITDDNDFSLNNANLVIDGPADAFVIFRMPGNDNMLISNGNILIGNSGIGLHNVMFYTCQSENDTHFGFDNTVLNGISFWSLGNASGTITINNAQGCTQLVGGLVNLNDVRFNRCGFVPEPPVMIFLATGALTILLKRKRKLE